MKTLHILLITTLLGVSSVAMAEAGGDIAFARMEDARQVALQSQYAPVEKVEAKKYTYGMDLDIAEVLAVTPLSTKCGVIPVEMRYKDSAGKLRAIEYLQERTSCRASH